jgi:hypothetical protein
MMKKNLCKRKREKESIFQAAERLPEHQMERGIKESRCAKAFAFMPK